MANWTVSDHGNAKVVKEEEPNSVHILTLKQSYAVQNKERTGKENTSKQPVPKMTNGPHAKYTQKPEWSIQQDRHPKTEYPFFSAAA